MHSVGLLLGGLGGCLEKSFCMKPSRDAGHFSFKKISFTRGSLNISLETQFFYHIKFKFKFPPPIFW